MVKIGVFDSGIGGITVLAELVRQFGSAEYVYLGDTAHVPYGPKSPEQIQKLSTDCAQVLKKQGIQALVVACNTASSWALDAIKSVMDPIPVFGVVSPGVEAALDALSQFKNQEDKGLRSEGEVQPHPILVLATRATVRSQAYGSVLRKILNPFHDPLVSQQFPIHEQPCPLLAPMIEEGWIDHPILHATLQEYVKEYVNQYPQGVALLGCTHYPWIHAAFEKALPGWKVVNSAQAVAHSLMANPLFQGLKPHSQSPKVEWIFTDHQLVPVFVREWMKTTLHTQISEYS
jgi:glutamate racemase